MGDSQGFNSGNSFVTQKPQTFSHEVLIMAAMNKVIEYGCQELVAGYYNTETDDKGKTKIVYKQDTRKAFIESIRTLRLLMLCDFDEIAKKKLMFSDEEEDKSLINKLENRKKFYLEQQTEWWESLNDGQRANAQNIGQGVIEEYFNINLPFYHQYFLEELEIYREIFGELNLLTKRLNFFKHIAYDVDANEDVEDDEEEEDA
jgi:hypothetical protein